MLNASVQFRDVFSVKVTYDKEMAARGVAERISMPWFVVREYQNIWATEIPIFLSLKDRPMLKATIVAPVPIVSTCPLVIYSCQVFVDESDKDNIKVTVASPMVPMRFQSCPCKTTSKCFELCSCLVARLFNMATNNDVHAKQETDVALGISHTLTYALENVKVPDMYASPYTNWTKRAFLFPYNLLYRLPLMTYGSSIKEPSKLISAYFDFTMFCQTYEQVDLYFSLCCYMQPARARLFMNNSKVAQTLLKKIHDNPLRAFLGQLIEVEGLRQAAIEAESGDVKKLHAINDAELQSAARVHEELLCESLLRGTADVQLYSDSVERKLLAWMGGILVEHGKSVGRLVMASQAEQDCIARLQQVASYWQPQKLTCSASLDQHLHNTHMLFVNNRGTCGRSSPLIKKELDFYRKHSLVTLAPSDVTELEDRFDELCKSMQKLYSPTKRYPVVAVVTIVDLHLFSPLMLSTILRFLLECQHGFKYNDIISPKTYQSTRTSLPFKFLFIGDFLAHSFRGGTQIANQFLDLGANRECFYRNSLQDVFINQDPYAKNFQLGLELKFADIDLIAVEEEDEAPPTLFRVHVEGWKTRLYRSVLPLFEQAEDDDQYIGQEMAPTTTQLPFSSVHLATTNPKHVYTALCMTAGDVILHVSESDMQNLALQ